MAINLNNASTGTRGAPTLIGTPHLGHASSPKCSRGPFCFVGLILSRVSLGNKGKPTPDVHCQAAPTQLNLVTVPFQQSATTTHHPHAIFSPSLPHNPTLGTQPNNPERQGRKIGKPTKHKLLTNASAATLAPLQLSMGPPRSALPM